MDYYKSLNKYINKLPKFIKKATSEQQREELVRLKRELKSQVISNDIDVTRQQLHDLCQVLNSLDIIIQLNKSDKVLRKFYWSIRLSFMVHYYNLLFSFSANLFTKTPKVNLYNKVILTYDNALSIMHYWRKLTFLLRNPSLDSKRMYEHYVRLFKSYGPESARRFYRYVCFIVDHYDNDSNLNVLSNLTIHQLKRIVLTMDKYYQKEYCFIQKLEHVKVSYIDIETNVPVETEYREMSFDLSMNRNKLETLKAKSAKPRKVEKKTNKQGSKPKKGLVKSDKAPKPKETKPKKVTPAFLDNYVLKDKPPVGKLTLGKSKTDVKIVTKKRRTLTQEQIDAMQRDIQQAKESIQ